MQKLTPSVKPLDIIVEEPASRYSLLLEYQGEIPFGPPYYFLWIRDRDRLVGPGPEEYYGDKAFFSPDGRFVALERWFDLSSPNTGLLILDLQHKKQAIIDRFGAGFLKKLSWKKNSEETTKIVYSVIYYKPDGYDCEHKELLLDSELIKWTKIVWW